MRSVFLPIAIWLGIVGCDSLDRPTTRIQSFRTCHLYRTDGLCISTLYSELWISEDTIAIVYGSQNIPLAGRYTKYGDTLRVFWPTDTMSLEILFKAQGRKRLIKDITFSEESEGEVWLYEPFISEVEVDNFRDLNLEDVYKRGEEYNCVCDTPMYKAPPIEREPLNLEPLPE